MKSIPDAAVVIKKNVEIHKLVIAIEEFFSERFSPRAVRIRHKLLTRSGETVTVSPELTAMLLRFLVEHSGEIGLDLFAEESETGLSFAVHTDSISSLSSAEEKHLRRLATRAGFIITERHDTLIFKAYLSTPSEYLVFVRSISDIKDILAEVFYGLL